MIIFLRFFVVSLICFASHLCADLQIITKTKFKPESFYAENISLLNNDRKDIDSIFYNRHTLDFRTSLIDNQGAIQGAFVIRNKAVWGSPSSVASVTDSDVKFLEAVVGSHRHYIPRMILWMRETWLDVIPARLIDYNPKNPVHIKFGAFPFSLGRGIALGDAYSVGSETLGFYSDNIVDQYAFGFDLYAHFLATACYTLRYDLYGAILQNKSGTTGDVAARILGQEYGRRKTPERRFGSINFVVSGRLRFDYQIDQNRSVNLEPYILYNRDPEQFVEFPADARARLATAGVAFEYVGERCAFGFDSAVNFGNQFVKGWDRNQVVLQNVNAAAYTANSNVQVANLDASGETVILGNAPYIKNNEHQNMIFDTFQDQNQNGKVIINNIVGQYGPFTGTAENPLMVLNGNNRFRNPYTNKLQGWMFVTDGEIRLIPGMKLCATFAVASGDDNPNFQTKDGDFKGFIPLQEIYAGNRVKTAFLLNGSGKVSRPISLPPEDFDQDPKLSLEVSGFTNLIFVGSSLIFEGSLRNKVPYKIQPDVIAYWQQKAVPTGVSTYIGTEFNLFADFQITGNMKTFVVGSVFFPGALFKDISGMPGFTFDAIEELDEEDVTGFTAEPIPGLGANTAFTVNIGIEYVF
jgi:hypothetical protein